MGVIPYNVVAVNPNLAELKEIGIEYLQNEPEYVVTNNYKGEDVTNSIIRFWLKPANTPDTPEDMEFITSVDFRINHAVFKGGNSGKTQFINAYGRTAWAEQQADLANNQYYEDVQSRPAHRGEEDLHKFLFAWLNMTYDTKEKKFDECLLDVNKIIAGDFSELKAVVNGSREYVVKCLTGVNEVEKEGKIKYYQAVYNRMFLKHNQHSTNRLDDFINENTYNAFSTDNRTVHYSYELKEFDKTAKPDEDVAGAPEPTPEQIF
jgi:hypothetical protein